MAIITTSSADTGRTFTLGVNDEFNGTSAVDKVIIDQTAVNVVVNGGGGADIITMSGNTSSYTVAQDGSRLKISNAVGSTFIPLSTTTQTIKFADNSAGLNIFIDPAAGKLMIGTQAVSGATGVAITGTGSSNTIAVTTDGSADASSGNKIFNIASGTYTYTISGFSAGDVLAFPAGNTASVKNVGYTDNAVDLTWASAGNVVTIHLVGISNANDIKLNSTGDFNTVFGNGTII